MRTSKQMSTMVTSPSIDMELDSYLDLLIKQSMTYDQQLIEYSLGKSLWEVNRARAQKMVAVASNENMGTTKLLLEQAEEYYQTFVSIIHDTEEKKKKVDILREDLKKTKGALTGYSQESANKAQIRLFNEIAQSNKAMGDMSDANYGDSVNIENKVNTVPQLEQKAKTLLYSAKALLELQKA